MTNHFVTIRSIAAAALIAPAVAHSGELIVHTFSWHTQSTWNKLSPRDVTKQGSFEYQSYTNNGTPVMQTYRYTYTVYDPNYEQQVAYNNVNFGIGYRSDDGWLVGLYRNSYRKPSLYGGKSFHMWGPVSIVAGVATGYKIVSDRPIVPFAGFELKYKLTDRVTTYAYVFPPLASDEAGAVHVTFGYRF